MRIAAHPGPAPCRERDSPPPPVSFRTRETLRPGPGRALETVSIAAKAAAASRQTNQPCPGRPRLRPRLPRPARCVSGRS
ncbi:unnamed protein product [Lepidochelys kempii]